MKNMTPNASLYDESLSAGKNSRRDCYTTFPEVIIMDQVKIGKFIASLRKQAGFTQEQLGEKLGATNTEMSQDALLNEAKAKN